MKQLFFCSLSRLRQALAFVVYARTPNFIDICMISDFFPMIFFFKFSGSFNFILFKHLLLYIRPLIYLSLEETDSLLSAFVLKKLVFHTISISPYLKPYFSIFHSDYLINIFPYLRALVNLGCQLLVILLQVQVKKSKNERK